MARFKVVAHLQANEERSTQDRVVGYLPSSSEGSIEYDQLDAAKMRHAIHAGLDANTTIPLVQVTGSKSRTVYNLNMRYVRHLEITEEASS